MSTKHFWYVIIEETASPYYQTRRGARAAAAKVPGAYVVRDDSPTVRDTWARAVRREAQAAGMDQPLLMWCPPEPGSLNEVRKAFRARYAEAYGIGAVRGPAPVAEGQALASLMRIVRSL